MHDSSGSTPDHARSYRAAPLRSVPSRTPFNEDDNAETGYVRFAHESTGDRAVLIFFAGGMTALEMVARAGRGGKSYIGGELAADEVTFTFTYNVFYVTMLLALVLSFDIIPHSLPRLRSVFSATRRAYLAEYVIPVLVVLSVIRRFMADGGQPQ
jgi:hypothetical protein